MDKERLEILIFNFYSDQLNENEKSELEQLLSSSQEAREMFHEYNFLNQSLETISLDEKLNGNAPIKLELKQSNKLKKYIVNVAAILAIPLLAGLIYTMVAKPSLSKYLAYNEITCSKGRVASVTLPDGSQVHLFSGATLKYPAVFSKKQRDVSLSGGEATFEVHANPKQPFFVHTTHHESIMAYGTKFIVASYDNDDNVSVYLEKGKVNFEAPKLNKDIVMSPKTRLDFNRDNDSTSIKNISSFDFEAYKQGDLIFADEPLKNIAQKLSKSFGVDVSIKGKKLKNTCFTASFTDESLLKILNLLQAGDSKLRWNITNDKIVLFEQNMNSK